MNEIERMNFKNYCVIVMGDIHGSEEEILKISEGQPNTLKAGGILIATFTSIMSPVEISDFFIERNRNFMVFDLDKKHSGYNFMKRDIHEGLFGFLKTNSIDTMDENFLKAIEDVKPLARPKTLPRVEVKKLKKKKTLTLSEVEQMTPTQKQEKLNELIDNGLENLTEDDKKLLPLLAK